MSDEKSFSVCQEMLPLFRTNDSLTPAVIIKDQSWCNVFHNTIISTLNFSITFFHYSKPIRAFSRVGTYLSESSLGWRLIRGGLTESLLYFRLRKGGEN